ncbi:hypothetical protein HDEF_1042 [Candidatus Hamiltonella defensa 5AT (Acyrthosiphon pisum)]|uniref:Uncharacterized protein n=1 Tax=Hamiltonella defensa subsp. Acyrthosiphon pisum (strain 5AT) TaxID=572265 RepID=C4K589_HAMD5|nr:hypothetical protein HDEF_1042 [Candidatus Hamiltonella defensa 5AT (Acyrthosiphon pisum)]
MRKAKIRHSNFDLSIRDADAFKGSGIGSSELFLFIVQFLTLCF